MISWIQFQISRIQLVISRIKLLISWKLISDMYISRIPITHITNSGLNSKTAFHTNASNSFLDIGLVVQLNTSASDVMQWRTQACRQPLLTSSLNSLTRLRSDKKALWQWHANGFRDDQHAEYLLRHSDAIRKILDSSPHFNPLEPSGVSIRSHFQCSAPYRATNEPLESM